MSLAPASAVEGLDPAIVDPDVADNQLRRLDDERAILSPAGGGDPSSILLLPPEPTETLGVVSREVVVDGWRVVVEVEAAARAELRDRARRGRVAAGQSGPASVRAIIPGVVVAISVTTGDAVTAGQQLLVIEAMKMQNELRAPRDGTIERVAVAPGQTLEVGDLLVVIA